MLLLLAAVACTSPETTPPDKQPDGDSGEDTALDTGIDSGSDSGATDTNPVRETCPAWTVSLAQQWVSDQLPALDSISGTTPGVALGDLDGDGDLDALHAYGGGSSVFENQGGQLASAPWTLEGAPLPHGMAAALADLDGDGDLDGYLGRDRDQLDLILWNDGERRFRAEPLPGTEGAGSTGAFADFDGDGDLDLYIATTTTNTDGFDVLDGTARGDGCTLWRNEGGRFVDATGNLPEESRFGWTFQGAPMDADGDGDVDLYLANDFGAWLGPNLLLLNDGTGRFSVAEDCFCDLTMFGMGAAVGDANGDAFPDVYVTNVGGPVLLTNLGDGSFVDSTRALGADVPATERTMTSWGASLGDLDGDTLPDLVVMFGQLGDPEIMDEIGFPAGYVDGRAQDDQVLLGQPEGGFARLDVGLVTGEGRGRAVAVGDINRDGVLDLVTTGKQFLRVFLGEGGCPTARLSLDDGALNRQGVGARVEVTVGGRTRSVWMLPSTTGSSSAPELLLGAGGRGFLERVVVAWPDGSRQTLTDVPMGSARVVTP